MQIQNKKTGDKWMFYIEKDGKQVAEMVYRLADPGKMIVEHTEVSEELKGRNIGKQLVHHAVEFARTNHHKIIPLCTFTNSVLKKTPAYSDVILKQ